MFAEAYAIWVFGYLILEEIRLRLGSLWSKYGFSCAASIKEAKEFYEVISSFQIKLSILMKV